MDLRKTMKALCSECGPSGFETAVAVKAKELIEPLCDETWIDKMGNLVGVKRCGKKNARKVLITAHLDEIGLMVTGIEDGFLRFTKIGGVDPRMLPDRELTILTEPPLFGVVAALPPHVMSEADKEKTIPIEDLRIDIGYSQKAAEKLVPIGTPTPSARIIIVWDRTFIAAPLWTTAAASQPACTPWSCCREEIWIATSTSWAPRSRRPIPPARSPAAMPWIRITASSWTSARRRAPTAAPSTRTWSLAVDRPSPQAPTASHTLRSI